MAKWPLKPGYQSVAITAIIAITLLDTVALLRGINGAILMAALALIGGLAGYEVRRHHRG